MVFLRKYNTALSGGTKLRVPMIKVGVQDYATGSDWTPAAGDVLVSVDGGTQANIGTLPSYTNGAWEFVLSGTELTGKSVVVKVVDTSPKAVEDQFLIVETFGNGSAMYPWDLSDGVRLGLTALPPAAATSAGGLLTYGSSTGQVNPSGGKIPATLAVADVTGTLAVNTTQLAGQAVSAASAVTFPASVGTSTFASGGDVNVAKIAGQNANAAGAVTFPSAIGTSTFAGGTVAGLSGVSFPTNFGALAVDGSGRVSVNPAAGAFNGIQPNAAFFANAPAGGSTGGGASAAEIWGYGYRTLTTPSANGGGGSLEAGELPAIRRGDDYVATLTGLGSVPNASKLWVTAKSNLKRADSEADFQIEMNGGLLAIAGGAAAAEQVGTVEISDVDQGTVAITLNAAATAALAPQTLSYDVQVLASGEIITLATGTVEVAADVTRRTS